MFFSKKDVFLSLNSARVPGIDCKWFLGALGMCATRSRGFPRSLSIKKLQNSPKIEGLRANPLLCLSRAKAGKLLILVILHNFSIF